MSKLRSRETVTENTRIVIIHEDIVDRPLNASTTHQIRRGFAREQIDEEGSDGQSGRHEDEGRTDHHQTERTETNRRFRPADQVTLLVRTRDEKDAIDDSQITEDNEEKRDDRHQEHVDPGVDILEEVTILGMEITALVLEWIDIRAARIASSERRGDILAFDEDQQMEIGQREEQKDNARVDRRLSRSTPLRGVDGKLHRHVTIQVQTTPEPGGEMKSITKQEATNFSPRLECSPSDLLEEENVKFTPQSALNVHVKARGEKQFTEETHVQHDRISDGHEC